MILPLSLLKAEGTKEIRPNESDYGNIEIYDGNPNRPFATMSNTDSLHRLYFHIADLTETIYYGFQPSASNPGIGEYRILDPDGNIVVSRRNVPTSTGNGYIETYDEAVAGPNIGGATPTGYTPLSYTPLKTGDYWIEFNCMNDSISTYHIDLFDITVVDASNLPITGRLWSYAWDLSARGSTNAMESIFYIYSTDKYITKVDLNGIQPFGFVIACNSTGTGNSGNANLDRQSVAGNSTYPEYKIFLNTPDPNVYDVATIPSMIQDLDVLGAPNKEEDVLFYLNMDKSGTLEIFLDLDNVAGYQTGGRDVLLTQYINAGGDTIIWNGKDALGAWVEDTVFVGVSSRFATGVTHLPLYDPEYHPNGFIVDRVLPTAERADLYWDDTPIAGTTEFEGVNGTTDGHNFPVVSGGYGNEKTINSWWNGFENNNLKSFSFLLNNTALPIELCEWKAINKGIYIQLYWNTCSEFNNYKFIVERSCDGIEWNEMEHIYGAGNSSSIIHYTYIDNIPLETNAYYRLKQVDYNNDFAYSNILYIQNKVENRIKVYSSKLHETLTIEGLKISPQEINVYSCNGESLNQQVYINSISNNKIILHTSNLPQGPFFVGLRKTVWLFYKE